MKISDIIIEGLLQTKPRKSAKTATQAPVTQQPATQAPVTVKQINQTIPKLRARDLASVKQNLDSIIAKKMPQPTQQQQPATTQQPAAQAQPVQQHEYIDPYSVDDNGFVQYPNGVFRKVTDPGVRDDINDPRCSYVSPQDLGGFKVDKTGHLVKSVGLGTKIGHALKGVAQKALGGNADYRDSVLQTGRQSGNEIDWHDNAVRAAELKRRGEYDKNNIAPAAQNPSAVAVQNPVQNVPQTPKAPVKQKPVQQPDNIITVVRPNTAAGSQQPECFKYKGVWYQKFGQQPNEYPKTHPIRDAAAIARLNKIKGKQLTVEVDPENTGSLIALRKQSR